jgi:hypothetical protein
VWRSGRSEAAVVSQLAGRLESGLPFVFDVFDIEGLLG